MIERLRRSFTIHYYDHVTSIQTTAVVLVGWTILAVFFKAEVASLPGWLDAMLQVPPVLAKGTSILLGAGTFYVLIFAWLRGVRRLVPFLRDEPRS